MFHNSSSVLSVPVFAHLAQSVVQSPFSQIEPATTTSPQDTRFHVLQPQPASFAAVDFRRDLTPLSDAHTFTKNAALASEHSSGSYPSQATQDLGRFGSFDPVPHQPVFESHESHQIGLVFENESVAKNGSAPIRTHDSTSTFVVDEQAGRVLTKRDIFSADDVTLSRTQPFAQLTLSNPSAAPLSFEFFTNNQFIDVVPRVGVVPADSRLEVSFVYAVPADDLSINMKCKLVCLVNSEHEHTIAVTVRDGEESMPRFDPPRALLERAAQRLQHTEAHSRSSKMHSADKQTKHAPPASTRTTRTTRTHSPARAAAIETKPSRPHAAKSLVLPESPFVMVPTHASFKPTAVGQTSTYEITIENKSSSTASWEIYQSTLPHVTHAHRGSSSRTESQPFGFKELHGLLDGNKTLRLHALFSPTALGEYKQTWAIVLTPIKKSSSVRPTELSIELSGVCASLSSAHRSLEQTSAASKMTAASEDSVHDRLQTGARRRPREVIEWMNDNWINPPHPSRELRGFYVRPTTLAFPPTAVGALTTLSVKVCNDSLEPIHVKFYSNNPRFVVRHKDVELQPVSYVQLPVIFAPATNLPCEGSLLFTTDTAILQSVNLVGQGVGF